MASHVVPGLSHPWDYDYDTGPPETSPGHPLSDDDSTNRMKSPLMTPQAKRRARTQSPEDKSRTTRRTVSAVLVRVKWTLFEPDQVASGQFVTKHIIRYRYMYVSFICVRVQSSQIYFSAMNSNP